ncbi:MAG TPA: DUF1566 domain-containing protein [Candidatus Acidoferrales bacterium]|nr:DUF1566 domain-containing protein [Candidatus Acidoferrales bacterium]
MHAIILMFATALLAFWPSGIEAQCAQCKGDFDGNGHVTVDELVTSVNNALNGCPSPSQRFVDNGDGTITDGKTGLMWEKKSDEASPAVHGQNTQYSWDDASTVFLAELNSNAFAGHTDWRMPSVTELQSLVDYSHFAPAVDPAFNTGCISDCTVTTCSCTQADYYWSTTAYQDPSLPGYAWNVDFNLGALNSYEKSLPAFYVRAVRGGS